MLLVFAFVFLFFTQACSTTKQPHEVKGNYTLRTVDDDLPPNLWSPRRRNAASYYHFLVGDIAQLRGDIGLATESYSTGYALKPNSFLGSKLVSAYALGGNRADSLKESRRMVLLYPKSSRLRKLYGDALRRSGEVKDALAAFRKAIELDKQNERAYISLISVSAQMKKYKSALKYAEAYKKNIGLSANAWFAEAKIKLNLKDYKGALKAIKVAFEMQSMNPNILLVYAFTLEKNNKSKLAITYYEKLFRLVPDNLEIAGKLIGLYKEIGDLKDAYDVLEGISNRLDHLNESIEMQKVYILWELKEYERAVAICQNLSLEFPASDQYKFMLAYTHLINQQDDEALEGFLKIKKTSEQWASTVVYASDILRRKGNLDEAIELIEEIKVLSKIEPNHIEYAARFYIKIKRYAEAIVFLDYGFKKFPSIFEFLFLKGVYQEKIGSTSKAIDTLNELILLSPNHASGLNFLGYLYAEKGVNLNEAKSLVERALKIEPSNGYYLDSLGWVYFKLQEFKLAEKYLLMAIKDKPGEGVIYEHLGELELKKQNNAKAIKYFEKALKSRLDQSDKLRIDKRYKDLKEEVS